MAVIGDFLIRYYDRHFNPRKATPAHEDFVMCLEKYMKDNGIEWADLEIDGVDLIKKFESYRDEEINALLKKE